MANGSSFKNITAIIAIAGMFIGVGISFALKVDKADLEKSETKVCSLVEAKERTILKEVELRDSVLTNQIKTNQANIEKLQKDIVKNQENFQDTQEKMMQILIELKTNNHRRSP